MEADLAILGCGAAVVSVYHSLPANDVGYILHDSGSEIVVAENREQIEKLLYLVQNEIEIAGTEDRPKSTQKLQLRKIISIEDVQPHPLVITMAEILGKEVGEVAACPTTRGDIASLVYTSGTTGPPKGVVQTHGNHLSNVRQAREADIYSEESVIFLALPLAHSFAKLMGYIGFLAGATLVFPEVPNAESSKLDPNVVARDIREGGATLFPLVPRLFEKMRDGVYTRSYNKNVEGMLLALTLRNASKVYKGGSLLDALLFKLLTPLRKKIKRGIFGDAFEYAISGGAKLPPTVCEFFDMLNIEVLEGYGLTETCVATNVNRVGKKKIGTVGPVLARDIEIKIEEDGEVLFKGPNIATGYYGRKIATAASWDSEGWFHTGDLGALDKDGFLTIVGRKKELIVTSNGKKVAPDPIESKLKSFPLVSNVIMAGESRQYCVALFTLNTAAVKGWAETNGVQLDSDLTGDEVLKAAIFLHVESVNKELASFASIKKIALLPEDFTVENGLLTPTFKVKRNEVCRRYKDVIDGLYSGE